MEKQKAQFFSLQLCGLNLVQSQNKRQHQKKKSISVMDVFVNTFLT